jgi:hypothetical protein
MDVDMDRKRLLSNDTTPSNGHRLCRATLGTLASFVVLLLASSSASAATLNVSGGQLLGASGVDVGGAFYNVEFLDGTCIDLYNGCDSLSDFTFQTIDDANLASQALLDQVFVDGTGLFDTDPALTFGCNNSGSCRTRTSYGLSVVESALVFSIRAINTDPSWPGGDIVQDGGAIGTGYNTATNDAVVWAVWTPVPEPGTALLLSLGLLGLSARKRRER